MLTFHRPSLLGLFFISLLSFETYGHTKQIDCPGILKKIQQKKVFQKSVNSVLSIYGSPVIFPSKLMANVLHDFLSVPIHKRLRWDNSKQMYKDLSKLVLSFFAYGMLPDPYTQSLDSLHEHSDEEFFSYEENELLVVVSAFIAQEAKLNEVFKKDYEHKNKLRTENPYEFIEVQSWKDFAQKLNEIAERRGRPITKIDFYGHGFNDALIVGEEFYLDVDYDVSGESNGIHPTFFPLIKKSTMASTGQIRFNSCFVGRSKDGFIEDFTNELFVKGAVIHSSKNAVTFYLLPFHYESRFKKKAPNWLGAGIKQLESASDLLHNFHILKDFYNDKNKRNEILMKPRFMAYKRIDTRI